MVIFNPDYYFRPDEKRVFVIDKGHAHQSAHGWDSIMHPIHAIMFSAFQHNEPWETVIARLSNFLERPKEAVEALIRPFIENPENVYVEQDRRHRSPPSEHGEERRQHRSDGKRPHRGTGQPCRTDGAERQVL